MILLGVLEPFKIKADNRKQLAETVPVFLMFYHLFCATDFVTNTYARSWVGVSMITITSISLGLNLFGLFITSLTNVASVVRR